MNGHSPLAPSRAFRWVQCRGSVRLEQLFPELGDRASAMEGTAAHWVCSELLEGRRQVLNAIHAPNGVLITEDMLDFGEEYADTILGRGLVCHVEQPLAIPRVHRDCYGTPDCWQYDQVNGILYVDDYKYGRRPVEVFEWWQAVLYVCGILDLLGIDGRNDQHLRVRMTVHQPRAFHRQGPTRVWEVMASDLRGYFNTLHDAAADVMAPTARLVTGSHCLDCLARHGCPRAQEAAHDAMRYVGDAYTQVLDDTALGREWVLLRHAADAIKARLTGIEEDAKHRISSGRHIEGAAIERGQGRQAWNKPAAEVASLGDMMGIDLRKPLACVTPKQAEAKGIDPAVIAAYSETPVTGLRLVSDTNLSTQAKQAFGK